MSTDDSAVQIDDSVESEIAAPAPTVGAVLQQARLHWGLSEKEVADQLHITMHYVKALESNNFDKLPGAVFAKGYIKSYALLLELDANELIRLYQEFTNQQLVDNDPLLRMQSRRKMERNTFWVVVSVLVFVAGFTLLWLYNNFARDDAEGDTSNAPNTAAPSLVQVSEVAVAAPTIVATTSPSIIAPIAPSQSAVAAEPTPTAAALAADSVAVTAANNRVIEIGSAGEDRLRIAFTGESWIEVSDRESNPIYRDIRVAGDVLEITGTAPFNILFGDAPFISLSLNGVEIDVSGNIRIDNSARLTVGL
jgi:cytoskeleton protein RodZ